MKPTIHTPAPTTNLPAPQRGAAVLVPFGSWEQYAKQHRLEVVSSWWDEREHSVCIEVRQGPAGHLRPQQTEAIDI